MSGIAVYLRMIASGFRAAQSIGDHMTRIMLIGLALAGVAPPALANEASENNAAAASAQLTNAANAEQARVQLAHQGYTGISPFFRDDQGRWTGTAIKDGKTVFVAVVFPSAAAASTN